MKKLTYYEQQTLNSIEKDLDFFCSGSLKTISDRYNISDASIVRLFKKLNYKNIKQMQMDYYNKQWINKMTTINENNTEKNVSEIITDVSSYCLYSIFKTNEYILKNEINNFADDLLKANRIIAFGIGNSGLAANYFCSQFVKIGINCFSPISVHDLMIQKEFLKENDILILFSTSLETKEIKFIMNKKRQFNFKISLFTEQENKSNQNCEYTIYYSKHNFDIDPFPAISALMSQIYSINIVFNTVLSKLPTNLLFKGNRDNKEWNQ